MTVSIKGNPELTLRGWAMAYRAAPVEYRFPSDPNADFFPRDMECAADRIRVLEAALTKIERIGWREGKGEQCSLLLIECRKVAAEALTS
jgi:hypothetical protein